MAYSHGELTFKTQADLNFVLTALQKKGFIRIVRFEKEQEELANSFLESGHIQSDKTGVFFLSSKGRIHDAGLAYGYSCVDGLTLTIPFGQYELLSAELSALVNKFKPLGSFYCFGSIPTLSAQAYVNKDQGLMVMFASVYGQEQIFKLIKPCLSSNDLSYYADALKMTDTEFSAKYRDSSHEDTVFALLELASTEIGNRI